jgi:hypothetical protein
MKEGRKLLPPRVLRPATSQTRLHRVLGRKSKYIGQCLRHVLDIGHAHTVLEGGRGGGEGGRRKGS